MSFPKNTITQNLPIPIKAVFTEKMTLSDICNMMKDYSYELDKIYKSIDIKAIIDDDDNESIESTLKELERAKLSLKYATKFIHGIKYLLE